MVVVDDLSKYAHFVPLSHPFIALIVAKAFVSNIVWLHSIPTSIVSDRDKIFMSAFWKSLSQLQGTKLNMSSSYHPQTEWQTEVVNRTLEQYLRCFTSDHPRWWKDWLAWAEYSYNTSCHSTTKLTPFEAVYGVPPFSLLCYVQGTSRVAAVDSFMRDRDNMLRELQLTLLQARDWVKILVNQHRWDVQFSVDDLVYLKLQPYRQSSVSFRASLKLAPHLYSPYKILARIDVVAYR